MCGVCLGRPLASGKQCICKGIGTEWAETQGLREALFAADEEVERLRRASSGPDVRAAPIELAAREALEFLNHSGNQRPVLSGKFATPSARYDWFERVKDALRTALTRAEGQAE